jgi:hypothetical protein
VLKCQLPAMHAQESPLTSSAWVLSHAPTLAPTLPLSHSSYNCLTFPTVSPFTMGTTMAATRSAIPVFALRRRAAMLGGQLVLGTNHTL